MVEWSALVVAVGVMLMAAASIGVLLSVRKMLLRTETVLSKLESECTQLSNEAVRVLERASLSLDSLQRQLTVGEAIVISMSEAATSVRKTADAVHSVSERATIAAIEHMERARLENERRIGEVFRWVDAGMTFWNTWNRRSPGSGGGHAE